ncbi:MAG: hypothetical protein ACRD6X_11470 [Pyrinomonadaceae bacterium]
MESDKTVSVIDRIGQTDSWRENRKRISGYAKTVSIYAFSDSGYARRSVPLDKGAFPLKRRPKAHSKMIHASPFCRNYGIRGSGTVAFNGIEIENDGLIILDLNKTTRVSRVAAR